MAFPTTGLLDDANRANNASLGSNWTEPGFSFGGSGLEIVGNAFDGGGSAGGQSARWNVSTYGPDTEIYYTITACTTGKSLDLCLRHASPGTAGEDGYDIEYTRSAGTDTIGYYRIDNASLTQLGATVNQDYANGDSIGLEMIGSTLQLYQKTGGTWAAVSTSRSDSTYTAAGYLTVYSDDAANSWDDFSGGTVVVAAAGVPMEMRCTAVTQAIQSGVR